MALQTSGTITMADIAGEFGGTAPHSLSEYYGVDTGVPSSGTIAYSDFYGAADIPTASLGTNFIVATIQRLTVVDSALQYVGQKTYIGGPANMYIRVGARDNNASGSVTAHCYINGASRFQITANATNSYQYTGWQNIALGTNSTIRLYYSRSNNTFGGDVILQVASSVSSDSSLLV